MTVQDDEDETETQTSLLELSVPTEAPGSMKVSLDSSAGKKKQPPGPPPGRPKSNTQVATPSHSLQLSPQLGQRSLSEAGRAQQSGARQQDTAQAVSLPSAVASSTLLSTTNSSHGGDTEGHDSSVFSQLSPSTAGRNRESSADGQPPPGGASRAGGFRPMASPTSIGSFVSASSASASSAGVAQGPRRPLVDSAIAISGSQDVSHDGSHDV